MDQWKIDYVDAIKRKMRPEVAARVVGGMDLRQVQAEILRDAEFRQAVEAVDGKDGSLGLLLPALPNTEDIKELAKAMTPHTTKRLFAIAMNPDESTSNVISAIKEINNRALGTPEQSVSATVKVRQEITDAELARRLLFNVALVENRRQMDGMAPLSEVIDLEEVTDGH